MKTPGERPAERRAACSVLPRLPGAHRLLGAELLPGPARALPSKMLVSEDKSKLPQPRAAPRLHLFDGARQPGSQEAWRIDGIGILTSGAL